MYMKALFSHLIYFFFHTKTIYKMILIAEVSSSRSHFCLLNNGGSLAFWLRLWSSSLNPLMSGVCFEHVIWRLQTLCGWNAGWSWEMLAPVVALRDVATEADPPSPGSWSVLLAKTKRCGVGYNQLDMMSSWCHCDAILEMTALCDVSDRWSGIITGSAPRDNSRSQDDSIWYCCAQQRICLFSAAVAAAAGWWRWEDTQPDRHIFHCFQLAGWRKLPASMFLPTRRH